MGWDSVTSCYQNKIDSYQNKIDSYQKKIDNLLFIIND